MRGAGVDERVPGRRLGTSSSGGEPPSASPFWRSQPTWALVTLGLIGFAGAAWMFLVTWLRYRAWFAPTYDIGVSNQNLWLLAHRSEGGFGTVRALHVFGDHASFNLVLLAPLSRVWPGSNGSLLYTVQSLAVGVGVVPLFRLARRTGAAPGLALVACGAYVVNPFLQNAAHEFHPEVLSIPLLLWAVVAAWEARWVAFGVAAGLAALGKEDLPVVVAFIGVWLLVARREWWAGAITTVAGLALFFVEVRLVIPHFNPAGYLHDDRLAQYGKGLGVLPGVVTNFDNVLRAVLGSQGLPYLAAILATVGFLPLLRPALLIPAIPTVAVNLLSSFPAQRSLDSHYLAPALPFLFAAMAVALGSLDGRLRTVPLERRAARSFAAVLVGVALLPSLATNWLFSNSQPNRHGFRPVLMRTDHTKRLEQAASLIPKDAGVAASFYLTPHVAERATAFLFPMPFDNPPGQSPAYLGKDQERRVISVGYIFVDRNDRYYAQRGLNGLFPNRPHENWDRLSRFWRGWDILYDADGILLARRPPPPPAPPPPPTGTTPSQPGAL